MSSTNNNKRKIERKSVRFSASVATKSFNADTKSSGNDAADADNNDNNEQFLPRVKRHKFDNHRMNEDEIDDVDDWVSDEEDDNNDEERVEGIPTKKETIKAQRARRDKRRKKREIGDNDDGNDFEDEMNEIETTNVNNSTSLESEGIEIEPFNMEQEQTDGTGYFDGDTYVFRKRDAEEEPDAWLDSLSEDNKGNVSDEKPSAPTATTKTTTSSTVDMDKWSKEQLYHTILPLVSDTESVMQAVIRYGNLLKRKPLKKRQGKQHSQNKHKDQKTDNNIDHKQDDNNKTAESLSSTDDEPSRQLAQKALDDLSGASNALLLKGDVDIYQKRRNDLIELLPQQQQKEQKKHEEEDNGNNSSKQELVSWEYRGSEDGQIHGPYTTEQLISWTQAGYFIGSNAVDIRTVVTSKKKKEEIDQSDKKAVMDDMLSDLMGDDDDDDDGGNDNHKDDKSSNTQIVRGEWKSSNDVDFTAYLSNR